MTTKRKKRDDSGPAVIVCSRCGHKATTRARGFPALGAADLAGKVLRCSRCGHRQAFENTAQAQALRQAALAQVMEHEPPSASVH